MFLFKLGTYIAKQRKGIYGQTEGSCTRLESWVLQQKSFFYSMFDTSKATMSVMWFSLEVIRRHVPLRIQEEIREAIWTPASKKPTSSHPLQQLKDERLWLRFKRYLQQHYWLTKWPCKSRPLKTHLSTECRIEPFPSLQTNTQIFIVVLFSVSFCVFQVEVFHKLSSSSLCTYTSIGTYRCVLTIE